MISDEIDLFIFIFFYSHWTANKDNIEQQHKRGHNRHIFFSFIFFNRSSDSVTHSKAVGRLLQSFKSLVLDQQYFNR